MYVCIYIQVCICECLQYVFYLQKILNYIVKFIENLQICTVIVASVCKEMFAFGFSYKCEYKFTKKVD